MVRVPPDQEFIPGPTFRIATWNVGVFVDEFDDPYIESELDDGTTQWVPRGRDARGLDSERLGAFAEGVRALEADVLILQGFESPIYLRELAEELFPNTGYRYFTSSKSLDTDRNTVLASRVPLGVFYSYRDVTTPIDGFIEEDGFTPSYQRQDNSQLWAVDVFVNKDYEFTLFGARLREGDGPRNQGIRAGQVDLIQAQASRFLRERRRANIIVAGDLGARPGSDEVQRLRGATGGVAFFDLLQTSDDPTTSPLHRQYLMPNRNMVREYVPESVRIGPGLPPETWERVSPHQPVVAEFLANDTRRRSSLEGLPIPGFERRGDDPE